MPPADAADASRSAPGASDGVPEEDRIIRATVYDDSAPVARAVVCRVPDDMIHTSQPQGGYIRPGEWFVMTGSVFLPFRFGTFGYDPWISIGTSLERAIGDGVPVMTGLWAALESDLFRFAWDAALTTELDRASGTAEYRRFATLNDLYRTMVGSILRFGAAPAPWLGWLRGASWKQPARLVSRMLTRSASQTASRLHTAAGTDTHVWSPDRYCLSAQPEPPGR